MNYRNLNHSRTEFAINFITGDCVDPSEMSALIQAMPSLIRTNGLGNAMIFLKQVKGDRRKGNGMQLYINVFSEWLRHLQILGPNADLINTIQIADQNWYIEAKAESYKMANILRFVYSQMFDK